MAYCELTDTYVLFGGVDSSAHLLGDTWVTGLRISGTEYGAAPTDRMGQRIRMECTRRRLYTSPTLTGCACALNRLTGARSMRWLAPSGGRRYTRAIPIE